jgi:hypothetical protein
MIKGNSKEKCARCKTLGSFICEHTTPVRDKFRTMQKEGRMYESPREYEELLEPTIYMEPNVYGGPAGLQSHNALSFQRLLVKQQKQEDDLKFRSMYDGSTSSRKKEKNILKVNSLRHNNVQLNRLSFKGSSSQRKIVAKKSNGQKPIKFSESDFFEKEQIDQNNEILVEDLDDNVEKKTVRQNTSNEKNDKKGFCNIL